MENLAQHGYGYHSSKIPVRILRIWDSFSFNTYYEASTNFILLDTKKERYWAIADTFERDRILPLVCEGLLYYISNFKIVATHGSSKPLDSDIALVFGSKTEITDCLGKNIIPRYKFNLSSWPEIASRVNSKSYLSDVGGVIVKAGDMEYAGNDIKRLNLSLIVNSLAEMKVSLWGKTATLFQVFSQLHRQTNVVIIVSALLVKKNKDNVYLSSTPATDVYYNPRYEKVHHLRDYISAIYGDFICRVPGEAEYGYQTLPPSNTHIPCLTIEDLLQDQLWVNQKCNSSVTIMDVSIHDCHQSSSSATSKRFISLLVSDSTGNTEFTLKPRVLEQLTGYTEQDFLEVAQRHTFFATLRRMKGAQCIFEVTLHPSSYSDHAPKIMVEKVVQYAKLMLKC